ncbi:DUF2283 domain-containing protein [Corynebacterium uterequi]|uniref:DUF2283 domain-containing protein n=1 Tax=Corynebacterium uterequi TaxID=1072256 RepID=UPI0009E25025|nr:DUF2283 domain-containing protein [Corynebacterium uterequi]
MHGKPTLTRRRESSTRSDARASPPSPTANFPGSTLNCDEPHYRHDREADAAYFTFGKEIEAGESAQHISLVETPNGHTQVTIDADSEGYLLGVEILSASVGLREDVLMRARHS